MCRACKVRCENCECNSLWRESLGSRCAKCRKNYPTESEKKQIKIDNASIGERQQIKDFFDAVKNEGSTFREYAHAKVATWVCLKKMRKFLTDKEYAIIKLRYKERQNLEVVGRHFGVTRERIRQIEAKITSKLKKAYDSII